MLRRRKGVKIKRWGFGIHYGGAFLEGYMTTKEAAEKWGISVRQVQNHCRNGRISGVQRVGTNYLLPVNSTKPKYKHINDNSTDYKQGENQA